MTTNVGINMTTNVGTAISCLLSATSYCYLLLATWLMPNLRNYTCGRIFWMSHCFGYHQFPEFPHTCKFSDVPFFLDIVIWEPPAPAILLDVPLCPAINIFLNCRVPANFSDVLFFSGCPEFVLGLAHSSGVKLRNLSSLMVKKS